MSQKNLETVGRPIAAINARDIDAYLSPAVPENVELLTSVAPLGAEHVGADGIRRFFTDIEDVGPDFRIEVQSVQAVGDNNVIAFIRTRRDWTCQRDRDRHRKHQRLRFR